MIELLLIGLAIGAFLFWSGEQREGAIFSGAAITFGAFVCGLFFIFIWTNM